MLPKTKRGFPRLIIMNYIKIKPHHLLDILKLYGNGIEIFVPDENYKHNFYQCANAVVNLEISQIEFTMESDDICYPCKFNSENGCTDKLKLFTHFSKNDYNTQIDRLLLMQLNLQDKRVYDFSDILSYLFHNLNYKIFEIAWNYELEENITFRFIHVMKGIYHLIQKIDIDSKKQQI